MFQQLMRLILRLFGVDPDAPKPPPTPTPKRWTSWGQDDVTFRELDDITFRDLS